MANSFEGYVKYYVENPKLTQPQVNSIHGVTFNLTQQQAWLKSREVLKDKELEKFLVRKRKVKAQAKETIRKLRGKNKKTMEPVPPGEMDTDEVVSDQEPLRKKDRVYTLIKSSTTEMEAREKIEKAGFPGVLMEGNIKRFLSTHMNSLNRHHYKPLDSFKPAYRRLPDEAIEKMGPPEGRTLFISGNAGDGKTEWARSLFPRHKVVTEIENLNFYDPANHDGLILDDIHPTTVPKIEDLLCLISASTAKTIKVKCGSITIPEGTRRVVTSNFPMDVFIDMIIARHEVNQRKAKIPKRLIKQNSDSLKKALPGRFIECAVTEPLYLASAINEDVKQRLELVVENGELVLKSLGPIEELEYDPEAYGGEKRGTAD